MQVAVGVGLYFYIGTQPGRLSGAVGIGEDDLSGVINTANVAILYRSSNGGFQAFNPTTAAFAPFKTLEPNGIYIIDAKQAFDFPQVGIPSGSPTPQPVTFANTLAATGNANTVTANGISLVGLNGDELRYNAATGSQIPCSMNLYLNSISAANQVAQIGFPAVYAGQRFGYRTGGTLYDGASLVFQAGGEVILNAQ